VPGRSYLTEAPFMPNSDASVIRLGSTYRTSEDDAVYQILVQCKSIGREVYSSTKRGKYNETT